MMNGYYGEEPFDLRLTVLRFLKNLNRIILFTLLGTLLFGGGYYIKNILLRTQREYSATSVYKVDYVTPPVNAGDYYINEATWNTLVQTEAFLTAVEAHGAQTGTYGLSREEIAAAVSAKLPTDWTVPTITITADEPEKTLWLARAVEQTMREEFAEYMEEVDRVRVLTSAAEAVEVEADVRPLRAFVLSGLLSFFFATIIFLLKELGNDSIWLPATLSRRYGVKVLGTINSQELEENIAYLLAGREKLGVCSVDGNIDTTEVIEALQTRVKKNWISVPAPLLCPESSRVLRETDGNVLVVQAGSHAGKPLEYVLEYLAQQECEITAVILWNADEWLMKAYYCFEKAGR